MTWEEVQLTNHTLARACGSAARDEGINFECSVVWSKSCGYFVSPRQPSQETDVIPGRQTVCSSSCCAVKRWEKRRHFRLAVIKVWTELQINVIRGPLAAVGHVQFRQHGRAFRLCNLEVAEVVVNRVNGCDTVLRDTPTACHSRPDTTHTQRGRRYMWEEFRYFSMLYQGGVH